MKIETHIVFFLGLVASLMMSCQAGKHDMDTAISSINVNRIEKKLVEKKFRYFDAINIWKEESKEQFFLTKKIDDFSFTAIYKPYAILSMEEDENQNKDLTDTISPHFKKLASAYEKIHFINLNIQNDNFKSELLKYGIEDGQSYYDRITYYSFSVKKDVYIVEDKDTLRCDFINFERTYEANPSIMLSLSFTRKSTDNNYKVLKLVFEDNIFNKGKLIFNFDTQPILLLNYLKPLS